MSGKVNIYRRGKSNSWHCSTFLNGRNRPSTIRSISPSVTGGCSPSQSAIRVFAIFMSNIMHRISDRMIEPQRMRILRDHSRLVVVNRGSRSNAVWQLRIPD
jgi:hypothetical protein